MSPELQGRLAYARAWYAHKEEGGKWFLAPSKFIGYQDIDAETYLDHAEESDGRRTEAQLQMWFKVIEPNDPLHDELNASLVALLAQYGKAPSTKTRINVVRDRRRIGALDTKSEIEGADAVVNMMVAVAKTLPPQHFQRLRSELEDIWS